jgi:dolichol-phosphate mannosyltransferase
VRAGTGIETLEERAQPVGGPALPAPLPVELEDVAAAAAPCVFVIPAYNEEENIVRLLDDLASRPELLPSRSRVIVVDDGSQDATVALVRAYDAPFELELVELGRNQGPGAAFRAGFAVALDRCDDDARIVTLEADTTSDLDALPEMLERADDGADLVLADWRMENVSRRRRVLSAGAGWVVRHALGLEAKTVSSFFRVYRSSALRAASHHYGDRFIQEPGFACKAEILAKLSALDARVAEVVVALDWDRRRGESKMPVLRTMLAYWRMMFRTRATQGSA